MDDIVQKVRDLNLRLQDIKREQVFQRVRLFLFGLGGIQSARVEEEGAWLIGGAVRRLLKAATSIETLC